MIFIDFMLLESPFPCQHREDISAGNLPSQVVGCSLWEGTIETSEFSGLYRIDSLSQRCYPFFELVVANGSPHGMDLDIIMKPYWVKTTLKRVMLGYVLHVLMPDT